MLDVHIHMDTVTGKERRALGLCLPPHRCLAASRATGVHVVLFLMEHTVVYAFCKGFVEKGMDKKGVGTEDNSSPPCPK